MANKFSKSIEYQTKNILERQAKERKEENKATKEATSKSPSIVEDAVNAVMPVAAEQKTAVEEAPPADTAGKGKPPERDTKKQTAEAAPAMLLQNFIIQDEGRKAKNKTFYLDDDVIKAIKQAAAAKKVTESKLVNDIFKQLLGLS